MPVGKSSCFSGIARSWSPISLRPSHLILELYTYTSLGIRSWISNDKSTPPVSRIYNSQPYVWTNSWYSRSRKSWQKSNAVVQTLPGHPAILQKKNSFNVKCHGPCVEEKLKKKNEHLSFVAWRAWPSISQRSSFSRSCSDYFRLLIELLSIRTIVENFTCPPCRVLHVFKWVPLTVIVFFSHLLFY